MKRTPHTDHPSDEPSTTRARAAAVEARLADMWSDPDQLPERIPSESLAARVRARAHLHLAAAPPTTERPTRPALSGRAWVAARLPSFLLAATMCGVIVTYVGWALGFVARLYLPGS
jgi:hypothetical protein